MAGWLIRVGEKPIFVNAYRFSTPNPVTPSSSLVDQTRKKVVWFTRLTVDGVGLRKFPFQCITCMLCTFIRLCRVSSQQQLLISRRAMSFTTEERGSPNTLDYRVYFSKSTLAMCCKMVIGNWSFYAIFNGSVYQPRILTFLL